MNLLLGIAKILKDMLTGQREFQADQKEFQTALLSKLDEILIVVNRIAELIAPEPEPIITFTVIRDDGTIEEGVTMAEMTADEKVTVTLDIKNPVTGKPAKVDGVPVWASSDETVITVEMAADGMSGNVFGVTPGSARVVATADADLGTGVSTISAELVFTITAGANPVMTLTAGTPESQ